MSETDLSIEERLRALMGPEALFDRDENGHPIVSPRTTAACGLLP